MTYASNNPAVLQKGYGPPPSQPENNHATIGRALERLAAQVSITGKIAESLGVPLAGNDPTTAPSPSTPTFNDKLHALQQLISHLEDNVRAIAETIG